MCSSREMLVKLCFLISKYGPLRRWYIFIAWNAGKVVFVQSARDFL